MAEGWTVRERAIFESLGTPQRIQGWLDRAPYSTDAVYRSPRAVMRDRRAHCVDGALFAAAALRRLGHPPQIVWITAERDDGHMLAVYRSGGLWGAVAKSNFLTLRSREPVYRTLRELMMSYFEPYFNVEGERSMRGYTRPLDLGRFDGLRWETSDERVGEIIDGAVDRQRLELVAPAALLRRLPPVDGRMLRVILRETDPRGLYRPGRSSRRTAPRAV
jgi:hypothetical protein